ncbi:pyroglutamyl-peptidase 1-like isoform X1 [Pocillopora damicornis]|uniref:pyroglutamyl-peptidase 1-like isoform X1 n=1 Tax=Pocillopora damicornis TaxID=46731 RepID=UPI000F550C12|nr:pyroglutamyl-peptidase 1-like isoform X1 [Pocillopora damicornis]
MSVNSCGNFFLLIRVTIILCFYYLAGFGPFGLHQVNTSWEAVKELPNTDLAEEVNLVIKEIPVEYCAVDEQVPQLWNEVKPKLCVHVGVHGLADSIQLEMCGHNYGYNRPDETGKKCEKGCCVDGGEECLFTSLDLDRLCSEVMTAKSPCLVGTSDDAGRFLCDYSYYKSLHLGHGRGTVAFVHVPRADSPYSLEDLVISLRLIIFAMLKQIS